MILFARIVERCPGGNLFGLPPWYKYLNGEITTASDIDPRISGEACTPIINGLGDIWLIVAAVLEMVLRIAALLAVGFVVYGGIRYVVSQGEPDRLNAARSTIINALIGLVVTVIAASVVTFVAGRF